MPCWLISFCAELTCPLQTETPKHTHTHTCAQPYTYTPPMLCGAGISGLPVLSMSERKRRWRLVKRDWTTETEMQRTREREHKPTLQQLKGLTWGRFTALICQDAVIISSCKTPSSGSESIKSHSVHLRAFLLHDGGGAGRPPSSANPPVPGLAQFMCWSHCFQVVRQRGDGWECLCWQRCRKLPREVLTDAIFFMTWKENTH